MNKSIRQSSGCGWDFVGSALNNHETGILPPLVLIGNDTDGESEWPPSCGGLVNSDTALSQSAQTHFSGRTYRKVGLSAKVPIPGANAFFPPRFLREDPIFPLISQQPTIGISSIHVNRLTGCWSIYWHCLLIFKMWPWYRSHYPEETHFYARGTWKSHIFFDISRTNHRKHFYSWK